MSMESAQAPLVFFKLPDLRQAQCVTGEKIHDEDISAYAFNYVGRALLQNMRDPEGDAFFSLAPSDDWENLEGDNPELYNLLVPEAVRKIEEFGLEAPYEPHTVEPRLATVHDLNEIRSRKQYGQQARVGEGNVMPLPEVRHT